MAKEEQLKYIASIVRALVTSRKSPVELKFVLKDYFDVEGTQLPFRQLGYSSALSLLQATGEFTCRNFDGEICICANYSQKTAHIESMIKNQKRGKVGALNFPRQLIRKPGGVPQKSTYPYNKHHTVGGGLGHRSSYNSYTKHSTNLGRSSLSSAPSYLSARKPVASPYSRSHSNSSHTAVKIDTNGELLQATLKELEKKTAEFQLLREKYKKLELEAKNLKENSTNKDVKEDGEKQLKGLEKQNEQNYNLNQRTSVSKTSVMQSSLSSSSSSSLVKSPMEQDEREHNNVRYSTNKNNNNHNSNNTNNKQFDLRDRLNSKLKEKEDEKKRNQEEIVQQQKQIQMTSKNKVEKEVVNKATTNTNKLMRPILGQTSKPLKPSASVTPSPSSSSTTRKNDTTQKQKQQQISSPHYIMGSQGQETKSSATASQSPMLPTAPSHNNNKTKAMPSSVYNNNNGGHTPVQTPSVQTPSVQTPSAQTPSVQTPSAQTPSAQTLSVQTPSVQTSSVRTSSVQTTSVQDRLKISKLGNMTPPSTPDQQQQNPYQYSNIDNNAIIKESSSQFDTIKEKHNSFSPFKFDRLNAVNSLEKYCKVRGYKEPEYTFFQTKDRFHCHVKINDKIFSSYPIELLDKKTGKLRTAEVAVERLRDIESRNFLPKCHFTDTQFEIEIYEKLKEHPNGVITKNMSVWFEKCFHQQLPKNWWSVLLNSSKFKLESTCLTENSIVYANTELIDIDETSKNTFSDGILTPPETPLGPSPVTRKVKDLNASLPLIELPWSNKHWSLLVTFCKSINEVWARLFGEDYSESYEVMSKDLQILMENREVMSPVKNVEKDQIYIAEHENYGWQRVKLENFDVNTGMCNCFYIDCGDTGAIPLGELYQCSSHFRCLPAQAICISLYGLNEYVHHPHAYRNLYTTLIDKSLIASIYTSQKHYESIGGTAQGVLEEDGITRHGYIEAVLYDTSLPDEDINVCDLLIQQMTLPPPQLKADLKSNPVLVTHINDNGDLYVTIPNETMNYVQQLILSIVDSKFHGDQHRVIYSDLNPDKIFLICDNISNPRGETTWYRGMLTEKPHSPEDEAFDIFYVDNGRIHTTHISKIFRLNVLSPALSNFSPQAIRVCLHDVPQMTTTTVARLRGLLPPNTDALIKVNGIEKDDNDYELPKVTLFTLGQTGAYCAVNDTLRIEYELESSKETVETTTSNINCLDSSRRGGLLVRSDSHSSSQSVCSSNNSVIELTHSMQRLSASIKVYMLKPIKDFEAIPALNAYFEIFIPYSANPMFFVVQPYKEYAQLGRMMRELQEYCDNCKDYVPTDSIVLGEAYATKNKDNLYNRAIAMQSFGAMVRVKYVDFGDEAAVRSTQLKVLPAKFRQLPKMAVNAKLYGIKSINDEWSVDDCGRFRELTLGKKLIAIVHKISYPDMDAQKAALLTLELFDTSTSEDISIHKLFIEEKRGLLDKEE